MPIPEMKKDDESGYSRAVRAHMHVIWDREEGKYVPMDDQSAELWHELHQFMDKGVPGCLFVYPQEMVPMSY